MKQIYGNAVMVNGRLVEFEIQHLGSSCTFDDDDGNRCAIRADWCRGRYQYYSVYFKGELLATRCRASKAMAILNQARGV